MLLVRGIKENGKYLKGYVGECLKERLRIIYMINFIICGVCFLLLGRRSRLDEYYNFLVIG